MITKDQLDLLEKPLQKNEELTFTIGGPVETAVHSSLENERIGKLHQGHRTMHEAVQKFRHSMAFKSREGLAKGQFQNAHQGNLPIVDTDLGYGAGRDNATVERYTNPAQGQRQTIRDERVKAFAQNMSQGQTQDQNRDR